MRCSVVVPAEPDEDVGVPRGAAILTGVRGSFYVSSDVSVLFGERCARALHGRRTSISAELVEVGRFERDMGEVVVNRARLQLLETWVGKRISLTDLLATDNHIGRRGRANSLLRQGRVEEAFRIDPRLRRR